MNPLTIGFVDELLKIAESTSTSPVKSPEQLGRTAAGNIISNLLYTKDFKSLREGANNIYAHNEKLHGADSAKTGFDSLVSDLHNRINQDIVNSPRDAADVFNKSMLATSAAGYKDRTPMQKVLDHFRFSEDPHIKTEGTPGQTDFSARVVYPGHGKKYLAGLGGAAAGALAYKLLKNRKKKKRDE